MAKVITIAQQKGGAGKTTVAAHLAVAFAQRGKRVAVVDIDPQGSLSHWHKLREERFGEGYTGLTFSSLSGWRVGSEVSRLRRSHDYIIIDSPPHMETEARTAIRNADLLIIPMQPSPTDLWATQATLNMAMAEKIPFRIVLNRVTPNSKIATVIANEVDQLSRSVFGNRVLFASALMDGRTATEVAPISSAAAEVKALAQEILKIFKKEEKENEEEDTTRATPERIPA